MNLSLLAWQTWTATQQGGVIAVAAIAAVAILVMVIGIVRNHRARKASQASRDAAFDALKAFGEDAGPTAPEVADRLAASSDPGVARLGERLGRLSRMNYEGRWLPDPASLYADVGLFESQGATHRSKLLAWGAFALSAIGSGAFFTFASAVAFPLNPWALALPLLAIGAVAALFLVWHGRSTAAEIGNDRRAVTGAIAAATSVLQDRAGVAFLVSELIGYHEKMREEIHQFTALADELATGEFAEGIKTSVREIMSEEVAPPLNEANRALTDLAVALAEKQSEGMAELADTFSGAVAQSLSTHLNQLPDKLQTLYLVAEQSADMMAESTAALKQVREDNRVINDDVREVMRLMALAKNDIANEMASISDNLEIIGTSTDKMTALYAGEETSLARHIEMMTEQLDHYSSQIERGIGESAKAIDQAVDMAANQNRQASVMIARFETQLAALQNLSRQIGENTTNFTQESSQYVMRTLDDFDANLAEVVERLTFTTAEIRDAIDQLPPAIRASGKGRDF
ncbi:MAG: hypothetical protein ACOYH4_01475 [Saccharofermentanales bacterium]|jgi:hypothetical protein